MNISNFAKERDEALLSLDEGRIKAYGRKYDIPLPNNDLVFWAGVHKAIMQLNSATPKQKQKSHDWLIENGFSSTMGGRIK